MKISNIQFSVKFPPNTEIRRHANEIEDGFKGAGFDTPQIFPFPDNLDPEAPRIVLPSESENLVFSQLSVDSSLNNNKTKLNLRECLAHIAERASSISLLLKKIGISSYYYSGIQIQCIREKLKDDPISTLATEMGIEVNQKSMRTYGIAYEKTDILDETYFINKRNSILRDIDLDVSRDFTPALLQKPQDDSEAIKGILSIVDINDRYAYMYKNQNKSIDELDESIEKICQLIAGEFEAMEAKDV